MNQVAQWPVLDWATLLNMLIVAGLGVLGGFFGGWVGHLFAVSRDKQTRKWQELNYWRNVFNHHFGKVQQIARVSGALEYVYRDDEQNIAVHTLQEQYAMRQARKARQRIGSLSQELGIDAGISKDDVALQKMPLHFN